MGDPSGIGPEIIAKALAKVKGVAEFIIIGDNWVFKKSQKPRAKGQEFKFIDLDNVNHKNFSFGKIKAEYGRASIEYLDKALELLKKNEIDCLVTAPISKEAVNLAGFHYSGHTEYLEKHTESKDTVMMLLNKHLKFTLVTRHVPLKTVSWAINKDKLAKTISLTNQALKGLFSIKNPRLVICGLNPHASDNGIIGKEETKIVNPVLKRLKKSIKYLDGALPADVAIKKAKGGRYDCVIAMYHDQALIPLKLLGDETGVNLTLGLPFVRTSPLHGTAFDIAGTNLASPRSMIAAIKLVIKCSSGQKKA